MCNFLSRCCFFYNQLKTWDFYTNHREMHQGIRRKSAAVGKEDGKGKNMGQLQNML